MVDLSASMKLTGDASSFVAATKDAKQAMDGLAPAAKSAAKETDKLAAETRKLEAETRALVAETRQLNAAAAQAAIGTNTLGTAGRALGGAVGSAVPLVGSLTAGLGGASAATGVTTAAMTAFSGLMSAGVTVAIGFAVAALGTLVVSLFDTTDAEEAQAEATKKLQSDFESLTDTLEKSILTQQNLRTEIFKTIAAMGQQITKAREAQVATLENARAAQQSALSPTVGMVAPGVGGGFALFTQTRREEAAKKEILRLDKELVQANRNLRIEQATILGQKIDEYHKRNGRAIVGVKEAMQQNKQAFADGNQTLKQTAENYNRLKSELDKLEAPLARAKKGTKGKSDADREAAKAAREAAKAENEILKSIADLTKKYDPVTSEATRYAAEQAVINDLLKRGRISADLYTKALLGAADAHQKVIGGLLKNDVGDMLSASPDIFGFDPKVIKSLGDDVKQMLADNADIFGEKLDKRMKRAADHFGVELTKAGEAFGDVIAAAASAFGGDNFGGKIGGLLSSPTGTSLLNLLGGRKGSLEFTEEFARSFKIMSDSTNGVADELKAVFGKEGSFTTKLGRGLGALTSIFETGKFGKGITDAFGIKGSSTGATLGAAIGKAIPIPGASEVLSIVGSVIGGLFKGNKVKFGRSAIEFDSGSGRVGVVSPSDPGNAKSATQAAKSAAGALASGLNIIAEQLGGTLGDFGRITIGTRDKKWRVNLDRGSLKKSKGAVNFGKGEEGAAEAIAFAIAEAVARGAVRGLSEAVQKALKSDSDVDKALNEALKTKQLEIAIGGVGAELEEMFRQLNAAAAENVRLAKAYGLDLVKVEALNAKNRAKALDDALKDSVGSLQDFLTDMATGDLFEGSATQKRQAVLARIGTVRADAAAGVTGAADELASLYDQLITETRDAFGTAGSELTGDRALAAAGAQAVVDAQRARLVAAQKAADDQAAAQAQQVELANENNNLTAITNTKLDGLAAIMQSLLAQSGTNTAAVARFA